MGDGRKAMYEDHDAYEALCTKHGLKTIAGPNGDYYLHERWIKERFEENKITSTWEQYQKAHARKLKIDRISKLVEEIGTLQRELAEDVE